MNTITKGLLAVIVIVAVVLLITQKNEKVVVDEPVVEQTGPIVIGFSGPLTGDLATVGENARAAVELAVDEVNEGGGINGRTLEVIYEDDQCTGTGGSSAYNKLLNIDKVTAVVGPVCSPVALSVAPIIEAAETPMLAYCPTASDITDAGDYTFRSVPSDLFQATFSAEHVRTELGIEKVAVLYINNDWGVGINKAFSKAFSEEGGEILLSEAYDPAATDLRAQMTKIAASEAELIYFAGFSDGTIAGIRQAKELGIEIPMFGADSWDDTRIWNELGGLGEGAVYSVISTEENEAFKAAMAEKVGSDELIFCSNFAYDNVKILAQVMREVGSNSIAIKDALYDVQYENGVSSKTISFDENGDPITANYVIKVVKDGKAVLLEEEAEVETEEAEEETAETVEAEA